MENSTWHRTKNSFSKNQRMRLNQRVLIHSSKMMKCLLSIPHLKMKATLLIHQCAKRLNATCLEMKISSNCMVSGRLLRLKKVKNRTLSEKSASSSMIVLPVLTPQSKSPTKTRLKSLGRLRIQVS